MVDYEISNTIKIIGNDSQTIHIILKKNEKININKALIAQEPLNSKFISFFICC